MYYKHQNTHIQYAQKWTCTLLIHTLIEYITWLGYMYAIQVYTIHTILWFHACLKELCFSSLYNEDEFSRMWKHENSSLFSVVEWWLSFSVLCVGEGFQRVDKLRSSCVCLYIFKYFLKSAIIKKLNKYCTIKAVFLVSWVFCICQKTHFSPRYGMYKKSLEYN